MTTYCYPYKRGTGWRSQAFRSNPGGVNPAGGHTGFDQAMAAGTPLYAPGAGIIRNSSWLTDNYLANDWWLTQMGGDTLVIDCFGPDGTTANGPTFVLAHLQDSIPNVGTRVNKAQLIALSGNTGTATSGPHCHIEALPPNWDWNNGVYGRVNPEKYFTEYPDTYIAQSAPAQTGFLMALNDRQQTQLLNDVAFIKSELENINTSAGKVRFRDFFAAGVRAAQETRDILKKGTAK